MNSENNDPTQPHEPGPPPSQEVQQAPEDSVQPPEQETPSVDSEDIATPEHELERASQYPTADNLRPEVTNVTITHEVYRDGQDNGTLNPEYDTVALLGVPASDAAKIYEENPVLKRGKGAEAQRYAQVYESGFESVQLHQYDRTLSREGSQWEQDLATPKGKIGLQTPRLSNNSALQGADAVIRMRSALGMGSLMTIPLVHSGFHITVKTPSDSALITLRHLLMEDKINLGRSTHGLVFSNMSSYTTGWLLDLAMDCVYQTTLKGQTKAQIRGLIQALDIPILLWGLAASIYPKGFQYIRADLTAQGIENKTYQQGLVDVKKLFWVDNASLTDRQRAHMSNRQVESVTVEEVMNYRSQFAQNAGKAVDFGEDGAVKIHLAPPSADAFIRSGQRWITSLEQIVEQTFTGDREDVDGRNRAIIDHASVTLMRQYAHWVSGVELDGHLNTDTETVEAMINTFSEDHARRDQLQDAIRNYIDDCTVALIAIPDANGKATGPKRFSRLIPLDVISVFFILLIQRTSRVTSE